MATKEVKEQIKLRYATSNTKALAEELGVTVHVLHKWASEFSIKKDRTKWKPSHALTQAEEDILIKHYPNEPMESLCKMMKKNRNAIKELARKRGIKRKIDESRKGTLEPLFSGTLESYYWLGFIAADGYVSKDGHLMVSQSGNDKPNVERLAYFLNTSIHTIEISDSGFKTKNKSYRVSVCDKVLGVNLRNMMGVRDDLPKTYTGISLDFIHNDQQASAFLVGFLEGDGNLTNAGTYRMQCHKSWFDTFKTLIDKLPENISHSNLRVSYQTSKKDSYCLLSFYKESSKAIRQFVFDNNLPTSDRKFSF